MSQWYRFDVLSAMEQSGLVPTLNAPTVDDYLHSLTALRAGGIWVAEILLRSAPGTIPEIHFDAIRKAREEFGEDMIIGAGTVQTPENAQFAINKGAQFIVSNLTDESVIRTANLNCVLTIPGGRTDADVRIAMSTGCWLMKMFVPMPTLQVEASLASLQQFQNIFPGMRFMLTGGVNLENIEAFFKAGFPIMVPGNLVTADRIQRKAWTEITDTAKRYCEAVQTFHSATTAASTQ